VRANGGAPAEARIRTAPPDSAARAVRIAWGGDLAGLDVCRDRTRGFPIFDALVRYTPDLFIGLGDMIYGDHPCNARGIYGNEQVPGGYGPATDIAGFWAHWRYTREDPGFARLLATTPYLAVWDDHEVVNDSGPQHDTRSAPPYAEGRHLLPIGMSAFLHYNPIALDEERTPGRLYRSFRWGRHVELFVLDTRQYRDANAAPDLPPAAPDAVGEVRRAKSLLGREQRIWLERRLLASDATWKVIVSSVPLAIPTGSGTERGLDGWASGGAPSGFSRERDDLLRFLFANGLRSTLWITTDVHFAQVFVHRPIAEDASFRTLEAVSGPLNAALGAPREADPRLRPEVVFLHAAPSRPASFEEAARFFNFGALELDAEGRLTLRIVDASGATLYAGRFEP
jgi:alkaline phosphatase D